MSEAVSELLAPFPGPWDERAAAHLLNRTGFSAQPEEIQRLLKDGPDVSLQRILDYESTPEEWPKPECALMADEDFVPRKGLTEEEKKAKLKEVREKMMDLEMWWPRRMLSTTRPLQEKLTLFWHGHFATARDKVKNPYLMWLQNETLRRHARGNFRQMVLEISQDPAMILWLDNNSNHKEHPNENYARELMELFTLGEGNYTEQDIKESARAFTGWGYNRREMSFEFQPRQHDNGPKTFMGREGNWDGADIVKTIFDQPACARFIVRKLWSFFAYENAEDELVESLAQLLRDAHYELRPLLWKMFSCRAFYSDRAVRTQIKSPIQLVIGSFHLLKKDFHETEQFAKLILNVLRLMGQEPFNPPNVKGWDGGLTWVNTASLLLRYNFASYLVHGVPPEMMLGKKQRMPNGEVKPEVLRMLQQHSEPLKIDPICHRDQLGTSIQTVKFFCNYLWNDQPDDETFRQFVSYLDTNEIGGSYQFRPANPNADQKIRGVIHLMMSTPQYQVC